jgi:CHAT domain-containing protein
VPTGALSQLPFQVLVTAAPSGNTPSKAAWLVRDHATSVLPAVSSLKALRRVARPSSASKPMIGFGNPLLDAHLLLNGQPEHDAAVRVRVQSAKDSQRCTGTPWQRLASLGGSHRGLPALTMHGGLANVETLRGQNPLPETANELCDVARDLGAAGEEIRLGARATEREVKHLSDTGQLSQYRVVHFATHGALAGELEDGAEPGLLMTPPESASEEDDGYLTASEIAGLKLDADWVVLSACNTAAGGAQGAEAFSGLARAFIYAQARALLVSHWAVDSEPTVKLITGAMRRIAANKKLGRAEALRQSMLELIDKGEREAQPAYWAPFVLVGEGGAGR